MNLFYPFCKCWNDDFMLFVFTITNCVLRDVNLVMRPKVGMKWNKLFFHSFILQQGRHPDASTKVTMRNKWKRFYLTGTVRDTHAISKVHIKWVFSTHFHQSFWNVKNVHFEKLKNVWIFLFSKFSSMGTKNGYF